MKKSLNLVSVSLLAISCFIGCVKKNSNVNSQSLVGSISIETDKKIATQVSSVINSGKQLALYSQDTLNTKSIVNQVKSINNVSDCFLIPNEYTLVVKLTDGTFLNFFLVSRDDPNSYKLTINKIASPVKIKTNHVRSVRSNSYITAGGKKVLILAPFQWQFNQDLTSIMKMFNTVGFTVDTLLNSHVTLDLFRNGTLQGYDVIIIETHCGQAAVINGEITTGFLTGEAIGQNHNFNDAEKKAICYSKPDGQDQLYFAVSEQFLEAQNLTFNHTWVYIEGCKSLENNGLANYFLQHGAIAYNGFTDDINTSLANMITKEFVSQMTNQVSIDDAVSQIKTDLAFDALTWNNLEFPKKGINVSYFGMAKNDNIEDYYLLVNDAYNEDYFQPYFGFRGDKVKIIAGVGGSIYYNNTFGYVAYSVNSSDVESSPMLFYSTQYWYADITVSDDFRTYPLTDVYFFPVYDINGNKIAIGNATFTILK